MSGFWIYQGSHTRVLNISGFWIYQGSEYTKVLNMPPVLNLQGFWIYQGSEYVRVTEDSGYAWIYQIISGWICLDMSAYARICVNMPKSAWMGFVLYFPIVIPCLLQYVETYFNVYRKLEVLVWKKMKLVSWRQKIWFFL